jgi:NADH-quinone oxidoreductase subunit G
MLKRVQHDNITLTIDGTKVEIAKGATVLEAAQSAGIRIPTLCYDRRLVPFGACRLCIVQQKGRSDLLPSCFTPAKEGMEIITRSPEIFDSRRLQLQLILLNHPMICPRCEKEGDCELQSLVYEYGVEETLYPWERPTSPLDDVSPLLQRDGNKCILCGRCVRICDEVQGVGELSFAQRGIRTTIDTDFHRPLQCEFCGQCLDTCPVGAITSDRFDYLTKTWEMEETTTPCPYCACGCRLTISSKEGSIKRVFSHPEGGPGDGNLCVKGRFGLDFVDHPERIKSPLLRVNGVLKETSWEEALRFAIHGLEAIKDQYGPESIAAIASSRLTNEEYHLFRKIYRDGIGTDQIDHAGAYRGLTEGLKKTLGMAASTNSIQEIRNADCILVIGVDPADTHPIIKNEIHLAIRKNKAQLIVLGNHDVDLNRTTQISPLSPSAILLLGKPGNEVTLINGMIETILREGLEDKKFIEEKTEGMDALRASFQNDGLKNERVEKAAKAFAHARRAMVLIGSGLWSHMDQKEIALASSNLALITGQIGRESTGILVLLEKCNSQGAIDMGIFSENEEKGRETFLKKTEEGRLKALHLVGVNSVGRAALEKVSLLIVQDLFMTEAAKMAHVVLPASSFLEKGGTFTNLERRVQKLNPLRPPLYQSKSDFDIFSQLLRLLESSLPGEAEDAVFKDIGSLIPHYEDIQDGEQWPKASSHLYSNGFPNGRAKLIPVEVKKARPDDERYPLQLIQSPSLFQSASLTSKSDALGKVSGKPHLEMNPEDARSLGIEDGEVVRVSSSDQSINMKLKYSPKLIPGVISATYPCSLIEEGGIAFVQVQRLKGTK